MMRRRARGVVLMLERGVKASEERASKVAATAGAEVTDLPTESNGGAWNRTTDLGIMSRVRGDQEPEQ